MTGYTPATAPPGLARILTNYARAAVGHVAVGAPRASNELVRERWAGCVECPGRYFARTGPHTGTCNHSRCGCHLAEPEGESTLPNKLRWLDQVCPIGVWQRGGQAKAIMGASKPPEVTEESLRNSKGVSDGN